MKYYVEDQLLDLSNLSITDIDEIKELELLTNLQELYLCENSITEIKGLEHLINLKKIDLSKNPIRDDEKHLVNIGLKMHKNL